MDVREKLVELSDIQVLQREIECVKRKSATNCTDCLNCDLLMTDERILSAYANAIDALQNTNGVTMQEWFSVKDRLPDYFTGVLVWCPGNKCIYAAYRNTRQEWYTFDDTIAGHVVVNMVTHWMPMPQPPKGE